MARLGVSGYRDGVAFLGHDGGHSEGAAVRCREGRLPWWWGAEECLHHALALDLPLAPGEEDEVWPLRLDHTGEGLGAVDLQAGGECSSIQMKIGVHGGEGWWVWQINGVGCALTEM